MAISEASVRAALENFVEPYLRQTLQQAQAVRAVELDADRVLQPNEIMETAATAMLDELERWTSATGPLRASPE